MKIIVPRMIQSIPMICISHGRLKVYQDSMKFLTPFSPRNTTES